jgi:hypothetical protein
VGAALADRALIRRAVRAASEREPLWRRDDSTGNSNHREIPLLDEDACIFECVVRAGNPMGSQLFAWGHKGMLSRATYVEAESWQLDEIQAGLAELDEGRRVAHKDVSKRLLSWGRKRERKALPA